MTTVDSETSNIVINRRVKYRAAVRTDVGRRRTENQDAYGYVNTSLASLFVVADGMGGARGGATASALAVNVITEGAIDEKGSVCLQLLEQAIVLSNQVIFARSQRDSELSGMGTTVVVLALIDDQALIAHVGDSRIYHWRDNKLLQLTRDHTLVQELVDSGAIAEQDAASHPIAHMLTRSLGPAESVEVSIYSMPEPVKPGDRFVLCSDGLYNHVGAEQISQVVADYNDSEEVAYELLQLALEGGGSDNVTVQVVYVDSAEDSSESSAIPPPGVIERVVSASLHRDAEVGEALTEKVPVVHTNGGDSFKEKIQEPISFTVPEISTEADLTSEPVADFSTDSTEKEEDVDELDAGPSPGDEIVENILGLGTEDRSFVLVSPEERQQKEASNTEKKEEETTFVTTTEDASNKVAAEGSEESVAVEEDIRRFKLLVVFSVLLIAAVAAYLVSYLLFNNATQDPSSKLPVQVIPTLKKKIVKPTEVEVTATTSTIEDISTATTLSVSVDTTLQIPPENEGIQRVDNIEDVLALANSIYVPIVPQFVISEEKDKNVVPDQPIVWEDESKKVEEVLNNKGAESTSTPAVSVEKEQMVTDLGGTQSKLRTKAEILEAVNKKDKLREKISDIDAKLELLVMDNKIQAHNKQVRLEMDLAENTGAIKQIRQEIEELTNTYRTWEALRKKSTQVDALKLAEEVAVLSPEVQLGKDKYYEASEKYLKMVERWRSDSSNSQTASTMAALGREMKSRRVELDSMLGSVLNAGVEGSKKKIVLKQLDLDNLDRRQNLLNRHIGFFKVFIPTTPERRKSLEKKYLQDREEMINELSKLKADVSDEEELEFRRQGLMEAEL